MKTNLFEAERNEVRAAVLVLVLAMASIVVGVSQLAGGSPRTKAGVSQMIEMAAKNLNY